MPEERSSAPGTTGGAPTGDDERRDDAGAREQGVRTEDSDDLSSPQLTVPADEPEDAR